MPAEPTERDRYAHTHDEDYQHLVSRAGHLCQVALRPTAIDNYAAEKLGQVADLVEQARAILRANIAKGDF